MDEDETPTPSATPAAIEQTQRHVQAAVTQVAEAAQSAPTEPMHDVLTSVKDVLSGVQAELKRANDLAERAATPASQAAASTETAAAAVVPEVEIETPPTPTRKVRRPGGRKVTRK